MATTEILDDGTIVTRSKIEQEKGWRCPECGGQGHYDNGHLAYKKNGDEVIREYKPPTPCRTCNGKGRVNVTPIP